MKKSRIVLIIIALILMLTQLGLIEYSDLSWSKNSGSYLSIISMILIIISMIYSDRHAKKSQTK